MPIPILVYPFFKYLSQKIQGGELKEEESKDQKKLRGSFYTNNEQDRSRQVQEPQKWFNPSIQTQNIVFNGPQIQTIDIHFSYSQSSLEIKKAEQQRLWW